MKKRKYSIIIAIITGLIIILFFLFFKIFTNRLVNFTCPQIIEYSWKGNSISISAELNKKPFNLLFDTGAEVCVIDIDYARELNLIELFPYTIVNGKLGRYPICLVERNQKVAKA